MGSDVGEPCIEDDDCYGGNQDTYCNGGGSGSYFTPQAQGVPGRCQSKVKNGQGCGADNQCISGYCSGGQCEAAPLAAGFVCSSSHQCASDICSGGVCVGANVAQGGACVSSRQCAQGSACKNLDGSTNAPTVCLKQSGELAESPPAV